MGYEPCHSSCNLNQLRFMLRGAESLVLGQGQQVTLNSPHLYRLARKLAVASEEFGESFGC